MQPLIICFIDSKKYKSIKSPHLLFPQVICSKWIHELGFWIMGGLKIETPHFSYEKDNQFKV